MQGNRYCSGVIQPVYNRYEKQEKPVYQKLSIFNLDLSCKGWQLSFRTILVRHVFM